MERVEQVSQFDLLVLVLLGVLLTLTLNSKERLYRRQPERARGLRRPLVHAQGA